MKIAIVAHVRQPITPPFMGGMEAHSWNLASGLRARGHDVVLFASGDSDPQFNLDPVLDQHYEKTFPWAEHKGSAPLIAHVDAGYAAACQRIVSGDFDVVHNNSLHRFPLRLAADHSVPTVTSLHVPPFEALHWFVKASDSPLHRLTVTSASQLHAWWPDGAPAGASVLHNGIDLKAWPFHSEGDGSLVWCGRITSNKGTHLAVRAARRANVPLTLYGTIEEQDYFANEVAPWLNDKVRYGGHLTGAALAERIGRASAFLFTPRWDEPFGLVAAEAMACGLPIASTDMGAAREVIAQAGIFVPADDVGALANAISKVLAIPRQVPRSRAAEMFNQDLWLDRCESLYAEVTGGRDVDRAVLTSCDAED